MRHSIVLTSIIVTIPLMLAGCVPGGGGLLGGPEVVSGNERYVTIHDAMGFPGQTEQAADAYCKQFGRYPQFQSKGGDNFRCSGSSYNLCSTYLCVQ